VDLELAGRTGLVTGASSGIGRGIAIGLAREGVRLAISARREDRLHEVADEIVADGGIRPAIVVIDALGEDAALTLAKRSLAELGVVEILVNNAGGSRAFTLESTDDDWDEALTLNFIRHRQLTSALLSKMIENNWGRIINITGKSEPEGLNGAFAAKAAMHSYAKGLSREVGKFNITVNSIPPGRIISEQILRNYTTEYREWQSAHEIPVGEYGQPEDVAALVTFLSSPHARYITGTVIPVDGGLRRYQF
jgi:3-oxoacyl-[acyl-carrier protein] reductase